MPDGSYSVSDIKNYINYITKKYETLPTNPPIHIYINSINNRLVFEIKDCYKLELQTPEFMKLFSSTKTLTDETKNGENLPSLEVVEVVLVQLNLVDNQYQQKSEVLYTFTLNKSSHSAKLRPEDVPEKRPDDIRTSPYDPICNAKGRILSGTYSGRQFNHNP